MCGIIGIFPKETKASSVIPRPAREAAIRFLATQLLIGVEERGKDATGLAAHLQNLEWLVLKQPVPAKEFTMNVGQDKYSNQDAMHNYKTAMAAWRRSVETSSATAACIGHARKGTKGSAYDPDNNHPIVVENCIIGVHNGRIANDSRIFDIHKDLKRKGEVDSEAAFQLQYAIAKDSPPSLDVMEEMDKRLRGEYATLSINTRFPGIVGGLRREKPLEVGFINKLGLILAASERKSIEDSIDAYNRMLLSLAGVRLPYLSSPDLSITTVLDNHAVVFDVTGKSDDLRDCVKDRSLVSRYGVAKTLKEYDSGSSSSSSYTYGGTTTSISRCRMAVIEDESEYPVEEGTSSGEVVVPARTMVQLTAVGSGVEEREEDEDSARAEVVSVDVAGIESLREEAGWDMVTRMHSNSHWMCGLTESNIHSMLGIPECRDTIEAETLNTVVEKVTEEAFSEGYVAGALSRSKANSSDNKDEESSRRKEVRRRHEHKVATFIANLKTFLTALLCTGDAMEIDRKTGVMYIDPYFLDIAKDINPSFDEEEIYKLYSNDGDIQRLAEIQQSISDQEVDDDEESGSGTSEPSEDNNDETPDGVEDEIRVRSFAGVV